MDDVTDLIQRQCDYLDSLQGPAYLRDLRRMLRTFLGEHHVRPLLQDINRDASDLVGAYRRHDNKLVERLREFRAEFVQLFPWADDSATPKPQDRDPVLSDWAESLAAFDEIASLPLDSHDDRPITALGVDDSSRSGRLARLLRAKLRALTQEFTRRGQDEQVQEFGARLDDLEEEQRFAYRDFVSDKLTSAGTALDQIVQAVNQMNRPPQVGRRPTVAELMQEAWRSFEVGDSNAREFLYEEHPSAEAKRFGESLVARLRPAVRRVEQELLLRIGKRRSLVALLDRFRTRCEWHDRDRLRQLAAGATRRAEEVLTAELSRWLFDQGLTPLSKPLTGGLQPDLLDPAKLYVEAKRYRDARGSRDHIVRGMWQMHDTMARLRGTPHAVDEGFYVVFREGGPRYVLPASVAGEEWTVFPVLIDIAPLSASGSRQREQPIQIPVDELAPRDLRPPRQPGRHRQHGT